eukprot:g1330.t1
MRPPPQDDTKGAEDDLDFLPVKKKKKKNRKEKHHSRSDRDKAADHDAHAVAVAEDVGVGEVVVLPASDAPKGDNKESADAGILQHRKSDEGSTSKSGARKDRVEDGEAEGVAEELPRPRVKRRSHENQASGEPDAGERDLDVARDHQQHDEWSDGRPGDEVEAASGRKKRKKKKLRDEAGGDDAHVPDVNMQIVEEQSAHEDAVAREHEQRRNKRRKDNSKNRSQEDDDEGSKEKRGGEPRRKQEKEEITAARRKQLKREEKEEERRERRAIERQRAELRVYRDRTKGGAKKKAGDKDFRLAELRVGLLAGKKKASSDGADGHAPVAGEENSVESAEEAPGNNRRKNKRKHKKDAVDAAAEADEDDEEETLAQQVSGDEAEEAAAEEEEILNARRNKNKKRTKRQSEQQQDAPGRSTSKRRNHREAKPKAAKAARTDGEGKEKRKKGLSKSPRDRPDVTSKNKKERRAGKRDRDRDRLKDTSSRQIREQTDSQHSDVEEISPHHQEHPHQVASDDDRGQGDLYSSDGGAASSDRSSIPSSAGALRGRISPGDDSERDGKRNRNGTAGKQDSTSTGGPRLTAGALRQNDLNEQRRGLHKRDQELRDPTAAGGSVVASNWRRHLQQSTSHHGSGAAAGVVVGGAAQKILQKPRAKVDHDLRAQTAALPHGNAAMKQHQDQGATPPTAASGMVLLDQQIQTQQVGQQLVPVNKSFVRYGPKHLQKSQQAMPIINTASGPPPADPLAQKKQNLVPVLPAGSGRGAPPPAVVGGGATASTTAGASSGEKQQQQQESRDRDRGPALHNRAANAVSGARGCPTMWYSSEEESVDKGKETAYYAKQHDYRDKIEKDYRIATRTHGNTNALIFEHDDVLVVDKNKAGRGRSRDRGRSRERDRERGGGASNRAARGRPSRSRSSGERDDRGGRGAMDRERERDRGRGGDPQDRNRDVRHGSRSARNRDRSRELPERLLSSAEVRELLLRGRREQNGNGDENIKAAAAPLSQQAAQMSTSTKTLQEVNKVVEKSTPAEVVNKADVVAAGPPPPGTAPHKKTLDAVNKQAERAALLHAALKSRTVAVAAGGPAAASGGAMGVATDRDLETKKSDEEQRKQQEKRNQLLKRVPELPASAKDTIDKLMRMRAAEKRGLFKEVDGCILSGGAGATAAAKGAGKKGQGNVGKGATAEDASRSGREGADDQPNGAEAEADRQLRLLDELERPAPSTASASAKNDESGTTPAGATKKTQKKKKANDGFPAAAAALKGDEWAGREEDAQAIPEVTDLHCSTTRPGVTKNKSAEGSDPDRKPVTAASAYSSESDVQPAPPTNHGAPAAKNTATVAEKRACSAGSAGSASAQCSIRSKKCGGWRVRRLLLLFYNWDWQGAPEDSTPAKAKNQSGAKPKLSLQHASKLGPASGPGIVGSSVLAGALGVDKTKQGATKMNSSSSATAGANKTRSPPPPAKTTWTGLKDVAKFVDSIIAEKPSGDVHHEVLAGKGAAEEEEDPAEPKMINPFAADHKPFSVAPGDDVETPESSADDGAVVDLKPHPKIVVTSAAAVTRTISERRVSTTSATPTAARRAAPPRAVGKPRLLIPGNDFSAAVDTTTTTSASAVAEDKVAAGSVLAGGVSYASTSVVKGTVSKAASKHL